MLSVANHHFFDLLEGTGIHEHPAGGHGIAPGCPVLGEFDGLTIFQKENLFGNGAELVRECSMTEKMAVFPVYRNKVSRLHPLQNQLLFFLAGVPGNVNHACRIVVVHQSSATKHVIQHAEDGFFIARNDARRKDHAVVFFDRHVAVIVYRDARERGHGLGLAAAGQNDDTPGIEAANVLRLHDHAVWNAQQAQRVRDLDVVDHAAPDESYFAIDAPSDVNHLLNTVNRRSKTREDHATWRRAAQLFDARHDSALGRCKAGALHVCGIAEERQDAFLAVFRKGVQIERATIHRRLIDLEIPGVHNHAERRANGECHAVHGAVRYRNKLDLVGTDLDKTAGKDFAQRGGVEQSCFVEALLDQRQRESRSVNRHVQVAKNVGQGADVIFVAVSEDDRANLRAVLL